MYNDRQQQIIKLLDLNGEVQLQNLKEIFPDVSLMTIRRDLTLLENDEVLKRTYGGAVSIKRTRFANGMAKNNSIRENGASYTGEEDSYSNRASENMEAKSVIAQKALPLVEKGRSLYLDAGTTLMSLARILPDENYSIVTSGPNIALELVHNNRPSVLTLGGIINRNTLSVSGPEALAFIETVNIDLAFMAASGFSTDTGFTVSNIYECELKRKVVKRSKKVIMLVDSSKIGKNLPFTYATLEDIDIWVCNTVLPDEVMQAVEKSGVELI